MSKKKIKNDQRNFSIMLIVISVLIVLLLGLGLLRTFYGGVYLIKDRTRNVKKSKFKSKDIKTVGWLRVQGTNIDYPVIYAPGVSFDNMSDDFVWTEADYKYLNNIVYISGHNIKNLSSTPLIADPGHSRFEQLMSFVYPDFIEKNQYIQYTVNGNNYLYQIFSVYFEDITNLDLYNKKEYNSDKLKEFITNGLEKNIYDIDVRISEKDKIISLNTCTRMFGDKQLVINAKLVDPDVKTKLSKVKKSNNYQIVNDVLKGGDSDEA